jgi:hypothetical protein
MALRRAAVAGPVALRVGETRILPTTAREAHVGTHADGPTLAWEGTVAHAGADQPAYPGLAEAWHPVRRSPVRQWARHTGVRLLKMRGPRARLCEGPGAPKAGRPPTGVPHQSRRP